MGAQVIVSRFSVAIVLTTAQRCLILQLRRSWASVMPPIQVRLTPVPRSITPHFPCIRAAGTTSLAPSHWALVMTLGTTCFRGKAGIMLSKDMVNWQDMGIGPKRIVE